MIVGRITAKSQTTIPRAVRVALGLAPGDDIVWQIEDGRAVVRRSARSLDPFENPFATFTEWADELDAAYDEL